MDHCVRPVTKGERSTLSFGLRVSVTDPLLREIASLSNKRSRFSAKEKDKRKENPYLFEDGIEQLQMILFFLMDKIFCLLEGLMVEPVVETK